MTILAVECRRVIAGDNAYQYHYCYYVLHPIGISLSPRGCRKLPTPLRSRARALHRAQARRGRGKAYMIVKKKLLAPSIERIPRGRISSRAFR